jgi:L-rhamnose isomerase/sugar isomerase
MDTNGRPRTALNDLDQKRISDALDRFVIELPSWGFANTGTRFGKYLQHDAAATLAEKFADAGEVNRLTGASPTIALHVLWDLSRGASDVAEVKKLEKEHGIRAGSINPNFFQLQEYKYGSIANPDPAVRETATAHLLESITLGQQLGSRDVSLWVSDGSNYPGTQSIRKRIEWMMEVLQHAHAALAPAQRMLIEYKPFEPAFYHTDIADWGMALELARAAGPQAKVLVDTGHHLPGTNIEQIVAWLLHLRELGGFHLNDRKYADDDLTLGSIDPYQMFRIFHEIVSLPQNDVASVAFMIDQSHNLKGKIEAMVQTVMTAQELYAKAALVDHQRLSELQQECKLVEAEECFRSAFWQDVRPGIAAWRKRLGLAENPLEALKKGGYLERIAHDRKHRKTEVTTSYA